MPVITARQATFNPVDYCFSWTEEIDHRGQPTVWYTWDRKAAHAAALKARNAEAKRVETQARKEGRAVRVTKFTIPGQSITRGGIGSGKPEVDFVVSVYGFNVDPV